jgi:hypothetical protein
MADEAAATDAGGVHVLSETDASTYALWPKKSRAMTRTNDASCEEDAARKHGTWTVNKKYCDFPIKTRFEEPANAM